VCTRRRATTAPLVERGWNLDLVSPEIYPIASGIPSAARAVPPRAAQLPAL